MQHARLSQFIDKIMTKFIGENGLQNSFEIRDKEKNRSGINSINGEWDRNVHLREMKYLSITL